MKEKIKFKVLCFVSLATILVFLEDVIFVNSSKVKDREDIIAKINKPSKDTYIYNSDEFADFDDIEYETAPLKKEEEQKEKTKKFGFIDDEETEKVRIVNIMGKEVDELKLAKEKDQIEKLLIHRLYLSSENNKNQVIESFINLLKNVYCLDRIYVSVNDLIQMIKLEVLTKEQLVYFMEYLLNTKTDRKMFSEIIKFPTENKYNYYQFDFNFNKYDNLSPKDPDYKLHKRKNQLLSQIVNKFLDHLVGYFIVIMITLLIISITRIAGGIKLNTFICFITMIFYAYKTILVYNEKGYFASSLIFIQSAIFFNIVISNIFDILDPTKQASFNLFGISLSKNKSQFIMKLNVSLICILLIMLFANCYLRYVLNYVLVIYLLSKLKENVDKFLSLKSYQYFQPFEDFSSFLLGVILITMANICYFKNINIGYDYHSMFLTYNISGIYYLLGLNNFFYLFRFNEGKSYLDFKKNQNSMNNQFTLGRFSTDYSAVNTNFWDLIRQKEDYMIRSNYDFGLKKISKKVDLVVLFFAFTFLNFGFYFNCYIYIVISFILFRLFFNYCLLNYSVRFTRIVGGTVYLSILIILMNAKNLDKGYFSEIIDYYDQRMFDIIKEILQFVMYSLLLFVVFFTKDFTKLHNYYNYNDFYYFKDEIYLNKYLYAGNEKCPVLKLDDIEQYDKIFNYKNCIKSTFCFEKTFIMSQLRKAFEIARLQSIQFENLFIIDVIERSERLINIIPLCADLIIIYWTFLILSITFGTNLNGFIITLGAVHKILILIKFMVIHAEYIKTSSHRFVITVFSTLFITRLMIMINTSDYLFFLLGLFIILYQVFIALFIYKFELSIFLMVLTYGILISRESTIIIVLCFTSLFYHFIHKFKKVKKATIIFFSVFLLFLLIITSDMYSDLLKSLTINIFYLDENSFGLLNFLSKNFFDFKSINIFERKDSNNYQTLLNFLSILKVDELPINTLQDISLEQLTIFSISELLQEI